MKILIPIMALIILSSISYASLECNYDSEPYVKSDLPFLETLIYWNCKSNTMNDYKCNSYIKDNDGNLLQVNPKEKLVETIGRIDKFEANNQQVKVYFVPETNIVRSGLNYTFGLTCGDDNQTETFQTTITPTYRHLDIVAEKTIQQKNQLPYIIAFLVIFIFVIAIFILVYNRVVKNV